MVFKNPHNPDLREVDMMPAMSSHVKEGFSDDYHKISVMLLNDYDNWQYSC